MHLSLTRLTALALVIGALVHSAAALGHQTAKATATAEVKVRFNKKLKRPILVDAGGFTLYMFIDDSRSEATCVGDLPAAGCGKIWPPLTTDGAPRAGAGAITALLGTVKRPDGLVQVTYNGHPLYYFHGGYEKLRPDSRPGNVHGQGVEYSWWVLSPRGKPIRT
jgi:predicted lipoprotein with Yx(FWY)xxD motif